MYGLFGYGKNEFSLTYDVWRCRNWFARTDLYQAVDAHTTFLLI